MKTQSCKQKGRKLQQTIVADLLGLFPHLNDDDIRSTSMGASGEDVLLSSAARACLPYSFEAKNQEKLNIWSAIEQSKTNAPDGTVPIVVFKKNGQKPQVTLSWDAFKQLIVPTDSREKKQELVRLASAIQHLASEL